MNNLEKRMVDVLKDLCENHCVGGIKAEFEAEGTRLEEALRLKEVVTKAGLDLTIKIGGCEALKDMYLGFRSFFRAIWDLFQVATARPIGSSAESESSFTRAVMNDKL